MAELRTLVTKIRSKNAGPFWLTIDIFCGTAEAFTRVSDSLTTEQVAITFAADPASIKRFDIPSLNVVKFSLPRPQVQGAINDRDMHGASWAALLGEVEILEHASSPPTHGSTMMRNTRSDEMTLKHFTACALLAASLDAQAVHANGTQPSFDCAKATSNAEELVCAEASIAALDRRLSAHYAAAVDKLGALDSGTKEALAALHATQRGWIKGRDECWKSVDLRACVKASYLQREAELVATWLLEDPASVVSFSCDGNPANEITAMFFDTELPGVRLEYGDSIDTGTLSPAASGSRYEASFGRFLWIKGDTATVSWTEGQVMSCVLQD